MALKLLTGLFHGLSFAIEKEEDLEVLRRLVKRIESNHVNNLSREVNVIQLSQIAEGVVASNPGVAQKLSLREQKDQFNSIQSCIHFPLLLTCVLALPLCLFLFPLLCLSRRIVRVMQIIYRVIQDITLRFNELDHLPQRFHRQHLRLAKGIDF